MSKLYLSIFLVVFAAGVFSQNNRPMDRNNYENEWARVAEFEQKSLPQSAARVVDSILYIAVEEKNGPQIIKALIHQGKFEMYVDRENNISIFMRLNEMLEKSNDIVEQSVLHSMLGELYMQFYQMDQWAINQRTELGDYVPEDMHEWTRNIFYDKVIEHLNASLLPQEELEKAKVETYAAVVLLGNDSRRFFPSMYDFLARRAIEQTSRINADEDLSRLLARKNIPQESLFAPAKTFVSLPFNPQPKEYGLWALENYRKLLSSLLRRNLDKSVLLTELEKLDYLNRLQDAYTTYAMPSLEALLKQWEGEELSVEIINEIAKLRYYKIRKIERQDSLLKVEKTRELYDLLKNTIAQFPDHDRISILENRLLQIVRPEFSVRGSTTFSVKGVKKLQVTFRNVDSVTLHLYQLNSPTDALMAESGAGSKMDERKRFVKEIPVHLPELPEYLQGETEIEIDVETAGAYLLAFEKAPGAINMQTSNFYFAVSDLAVFTRATGKDRYDFFVVDRVTGEPVRDAAIEIYKLPGNWRNSTLTLEKSIPVNHDGLATYHKEIPNNDVYYHAVSGSDNGSLLNRLPFAYYRSNSVESEFPKEEAAIFTDRGLYRPGQVVYFKSILARVDRDRNVVLEGRDMEFTLLDVNGREISKQSLKTNEFGSVSGEFILPQGLLPGFFSIITESGNTNFRVEEYKRPTFEVTFNKIERTYRFGEPITLTGKVQSFSEISLQQVDADYHITRLQPWWRMWGGSPESFASGSVTTGDDGSFEIVFTPEKPDAQRTSKAIFSFRVDVTVTDINGETQTATYTVTVGDISMVLSVEMTTPWAKEDGGAIVFTARNLDGNDVAASGTYQVFSLLENDSINKLEATGVFKTGEQPALKDQLVTLPSGKYRLKLLSEDDRGNPIETEKNIILFSYSDTRPPIRTNDWLVEKNLTFSPGKKAEVIFGVSDKVHILYELWQQDNLLERKWITLENENRLFSFSDEEKYKEAITLMLTYVKDERFFGKRIEITRGKEQKKLNVKLDVFRDKIRPGSEEEWQVSVKDADGNPAVAEALASMYNFSLDNIYRTDDWNLSFNSFINRSSRMGLTSDQSFRWGTMNGTFSGFNLRDVKEFMFDRFNWHGFSFNARQLMLRSATAKSESVENNQEVFNIIMHDDQQRNAIVQDFAASGNAFLPSPPPPAGIPSESFEAPQVRSNFNETAFFYPHLKTNDQGEVKIAFTVPESNTRWRFRVLAHDKQLNSGQAEAFAVSQKELMVTPGLPRFLRHGDRTAISTKISNLSDSTVNGHVTLEFFDPVTDEIVQTIPFENREQPFSLAKGASSDAWWTFDVPTDIDILGVRIVARSEQFSDGEQHALVVLPNRMLVTESMRMDVRAGQTKAFTMDRLVNNTSKTLQDYRLTLEFTSNPAWFAVQALPVLGEPESENAVSWFASYYANTLGAHIGQAFPKVKAMIEAWQKQGGSKETLLSKLEKNQELKSVLLEETPWVMAAKNETEQKQRLALLFDLNRSNNLTLTAVNRLKDLQANQGGWSWFKGFSPSVSITQYILYGFNQLKELGAADFSDELLSMQQNAIGFIDAEALRRFEALKKNNTGWKDIKSFSITDLEYLYVRSAYDTNPLDEEVKELTDFYLSVVEKNWTQFGLYPRALIAVLMDRAGKRDVLEAILASYREHATQSDEMGMSWANNRAHVFMSQSAVSVHTFIMDAFRVGGATSEEMDEMKLWLLKQKQVQVWETTHATADAVFALLSDGSDWFTPGGETSIKVGGVQVKPESQELGTGYFKTSWSRTEIKPEMGRVHVSHQGNAPAWGALYWQYFEELDKIEKTDASLDIEKQLFVERTTASGKQLLRITEESPLETGDKVVVRLTVRSDRDMEFVHLKDMRAAAFEPADQISRMGWQNGVPYYQTSKDASTNFYFNVLPRGTWLFEYAVHVTRPGSYSNGITTIQSMYAPEFTSHTAGIRIFVK